MSGKNLGALYSADAHFCRELRDRRFYTSTHFGSQEYSQESFGYGRDSGSSCDGTLV